MSPDGDRQFGPGQNFEPNPCIFLSAISRCAPKKPDYFELISRNFVRLLLISSLKFSIYTGTAVPKTQLPLAHAQNTPTPTHSKLKALPLDVDAWRIAGLLHGYQSHTS
jgi:hypothetical protein